MTRLSSLLPSVLLASVSLAAAASEQLAAPTEGKIRVAIALSHGAQMIDFAGPWEVFQDVHITSRGSSHDEMMPFELFTVAASREPVEVTGGMMVLPDYTFDDAPQPHVIVVPAMSGSQELHAWLRAASERADVTMSVCTGSFQLGAAGLLDGQRATTHHRFLNSFEERYPRVELERGVRWVDNGRIATAAGLTSGIDLALHVVARYFGEDVARETAEYMEHDSTDWMGTGTRNASIGGSNAYSQLALQGLDPILLIEGEESEGRADLRLVHDSFEYRFASEAHRERFAGDPDRYGIQLGGDCAAMPGSGGGNPGLFTVHDGRIYIFASASCRKEFSEAPASYVERHADVR